MVGVVAIAGQWCIQYDLTPISPLPTPLLPALRQAPPLQARPPE